MWSKYVVIALAFVMVALLVVRLQLIGSYRTDIAGAEFNVVYGVQKVMLGRPLYEDPELPPFDIIQYTPLYYWVCGGVGKVLGIDPMDPHKVFVLSRVLSLIFNAITVLLMYTAMVRVVARRYAAWAALLAFAAFSQHFFSRSDALYALFFIAALHSFMHWLDGGEKRNIHLALTAVCAALSFMAKQTGVLIIGLIPLYLVLAREWRPLLRYVILIAASLGACLLLIAAVVPFDLFIKNTVQGLMNGTSTRFLEVLVQPHLYVYYIGWHIASLLLIVPLWRSHRPLLRFFAVALPVSLVFSFVTATKSGSDFNYFFENMVLCFMALALYFAHGEAQRAATERWRRMQRWIAMATMVYGLAFAVHRTRMFRDWSLHHNDPVELLAGYNEDLQVREVLKGELGLRADEGVFITYRGYLEHLMVGQSMLTQKDIIEWSVVPPFDYTRFDRAMRDGSIRYVISEEPVETLHFLGRSYTGFHQVRHIGTRYILARTPD
ncbi:MAG TPA: glycosyltransferase family 39 protein [Flavobacteriales bacterium]|nr:glycosyltransferase family 39 protein [Flavobacteriales bacterium]